MQPDGQSTRLLSNTDVGAVPLTFFIGIAAIVALSASVGLLSKNMVGGLAVIITLGSALAKIGHTVPVLKDIGRPVVLCLIMPSVLVYFGVFEAHMLDTVRLLIKETDLLYFVIACLVVRSILGMDRATLIQGMVRMFTPLVTGTGAAILTGLPVGSLFGYSIYHTFFFIIVPIIGGGVSGGIPPLSLAYSATLGQTPDVYVAQLAPAAMVGNIFATMCAGFLVCMGTHRPALSDNGMLIRSHDDSSVSAQHQSTQPTDFQLMGAGPSMIHTFFIVGSLLEKVVHISRPVLMILAAIFCRYTNVILAAMEPGAHSCYKFISATLVWPLMIGLSMLYVPLESMVSVFSAGYVVVYGSIVTTMALGGFFIIARLNMYPVKVAIVTSYHGGLGRTEDVAILSASNRMGLMSSAQIATRIGGASTVIAATLLLNWVV